MIYPAVGNKIIRIKPKGMVKAMQLTLWWREWKQPSIYLQNC